MAESLKVEDIIQGYRGEFSYNGSLLLTCEEFRIYAAINNSPIQTMGTPQTKSKYVSHQLFVEFTEFVVKDSDIQDQVIAALNDGCLMDQLSFNFTGRINSCDSGYSDSISLTDCKPDGDFDIISVKVNDFIRRTTRFVSNGKIQKISS